MSFIEIEDSLLAKAKRAGNHKSANETIIAALNEYIQHRKQLEIIQLFGKIEYNNDYDYKKQRDIS